MKIKVTVSSGNKQPWSHVYHTPSISDMPYTKALMMILKKYDDRGEHVRAIEIMFPEPQ